MRWPWQWEVNPPAPPSCTSAAKEEIAELESAIIAERERLGGAVRKFESELRRFEQALRGMNRTAHR